MDDTYRLGNVVTLNLGLRYDHSQAQYQSFPILDASGNATGQFAPGNDDVYHWNVVSPRIGATWKVNQSGRTVVKGYYGLLYRGIFLNDFTRGGPVGDAEIHLRHHTDGRADQLRRRQQQFEPDDRSRTTKIPTRTK